MVKFMKPDLPTHKILDINMSTEYTTSSNQRKPDTLDKNKNIDNSLSDVTDSLNFDVTALLIRLLTFKSELLVCIKHLNNYCEERKKAEEKIEEENILLQKWLINLIIKLDEICKLLIIRFRLRGVNESSKYSIME